MQNLNFVRICIRVNIEVRLNKLANYCSGRKGSISDVLGSWDLAQNSLSLILIGDTGLICKIAAPRQISWLIWEEALVYITSLLLLLGCGPLLILEGLRAECLKHLALLEGVHIVTQLLGVLLLQDDLGDRWFNLDCGSLYRLQTI